MSIQNLENERPRASLEVRYGADRVLALDSRDWKRSFGTYLPSVDPVTKNYSLPPRGASITLSLCPRGKRLPKASSNRLLKFLRSLGLGQSVSNVISLRSIGEIRRIEETIHGIVDSLLLFDSDVFDVKNRQVGVRLVRTVFKVGASSLPMVIKDWKQLSNYIYIVSSGAIVDVAPVLRTGNCLAFLLRIPQVQCLLSDPKGITKRQLSSIAHLVSTRQLPSGDHRALQAARREFYELTSKPYPIDPTWLRRLEESAERIGTGLRRKDETIDKISSHISLSHAGSLNYTVAQGGRAEEIIDQLRSTLTFAPGRELCREMSNPWFLITGRPHSFVSEEFPDWTQEQSYFFEVTMVLGQPLLCPMGEERWRYWFRSPKDTRDQFQQSLNDLTHKDAFGAQTTKVLMKRKDPNDDPTIGPRQEDQVYRCGFDHAIGNQIYAVAFLEAECHFLLEDTIPIRFLSVPEPGYKTRIVTTGPFWVQTLGQPIGHVFREFLERIPEAEAGLRKADQAWQFVQRAYGLSMTDPLTLSSDLKNATDAIDPSIGVGLLRGFAKGLGVHDNQAVQTVLRIVGTPRRTSTSFYEGGRLVNLSWTLQRGVLMGEPTTKSILTLLNLCCEEIARRDFLRPKAGEQLSGPDPLDPTPRPSWWIFAIGGDDHIAMGPEEYLDNITGNLRLSGCIISPTKHAKSRTYVMYCEKVVEVRKIPGFTREQCKRINTSTDAYEASPMVDSVKVRLLSPCSKSIEVGNEKNVGIGKGKSLSASINYLNRDHFPWKWLSMVRDRFFARMGALFPSRYSGVYWHLLLPTRFGGLGLLLEEDLEVIWRKLPPPSRRLVYDVGDDLAEADMVKDFSAFTSNTTYRGYRQTSLMERVDTELLPLIQRKMERKPWKQLLIENDMLDLHPFKAAKLLAGKGWVSDKGLKETLFRPILFSNILGGQAKPVPYNTMSFKHRYAILWDKYYLGPDLEYDDECPMGLDRLKEAIFRKDTGYLYLKSSIPVAITMTNGSVVSIPWIESIPIGLPELVVDAGGLTLGESQVSPLEQVSTSSGSTKFGSLSVSTQGTLASLNLVKLKESGSKGLDYLKAPPSETPAKMDVRGLIAKGYVPGVDFVCTEPEDIAILDELGLAQTVALPEDDECDWGFAIRSDPEESPKESSPESSPPSSPPKVKKRRRRDDGSPRPKAKKKRHTRVKRKRGRSPKETSPLPSVKRARDDID